MRSPLAFLTVVFSISLVPIGARAQWQPDGVALSTATNDQATPRIVSDGAGGSIVTWYDLRSGSPDIYAQRVNASGVPQWTADGVALCTAAFDQSAPTIVSDGAGGAIVTWFDLRSGTTYDIYTQRVNASGAPQWTADGVALCTALDNQSTPTIVSDGAGGAIVTWYDYRNGTADIYAQRVNASGAPQWTADGVALSTAASEQSSPTIVSDGAGGAIVTWHDFRSGTFSDIYARRVNASGAPQWTADGVALSTAANNQFYPTIVSDGAGGAIVTWYDLRSGTNWDVYAQRVIASGAPQWAADGVALCTAANEQSSPTIVSDGSGGAIVTWNDYRSGVSNDIYAQRMNASGAPQWTANGVALCTAVNNQALPTIVSDGAGGATVTWSDFRSGNYDVYAQRVNASGAPQWAVDGVALSTAAGNQYYPTIVSDGAGGVIVAWEDLRSGTTDIYAQRVEGRYGYWGHPEPVVTSVQDIHHDQGGKVAVNWEASGRDLPMPATIDYYSIWRAVDIAQVVASTGGTSILTAIESVDPDFRVPVYATIPNSDYYWELVGTQTAYRWTHYSFSAPTRADSVAGDTGTEFFMVAAHDVTDEHIAFASNAVSGHSVDNLSPEAPLLLTAQRAGPDVQLRWNRVRVPDLRDYSVYRATSSGVTPVPINFLASSEDTVAIDASAPTSGLYYIVTACDVHANQSAPSNEASVGATTNVGHTPPITALAVLDNVPNPFTATTTLRVGLPRASEVEIEVFDVAGRRVRSESQRTLAAGWRDIVFDGRDSKGRLLPSGVYFYRVNAAGETLTRKMVIAR